MKKMIAFLLAAILVLGCTACGSKKDEGNDRLAQIKEKGYAGSLAGFAGKVLLVGVSYDKKTRRHEAVIEEWQSHGA